MVTVEQMAEVLGVKPFKIIRVMMEADWFVSADSPLTIEQITYLNEKFPMEDQEPTLEEIKSDIGFRLLDEEPRRSVTFYRPVTLSQIVCILDVEDEKFAHCIALLKITTSRSEELEDVDVGRVCQYFEVDYIIDDDNRGGVEDPAKVGPPSPPVRDAEKEW